MKPVWPLITSRWVDLAWSGLLMIDHDGTKEMGRGAEGRVGRQLDEVDDVLPSGRQSV